MTTLTASLEERIGESTRQHVREQVAHGTGDAQDATAQPSHWFARWVDTTISKQLAERVLTRVSTQRGRVAEAIHKLPERMHLLANQTKLMLELVEDFRTGAYRKLPWRSLAIAAGAILYAASPADLLPDVLIGFGALDDIAIAALAVRAVRADLIKYCEFKGYDVQQYFPSSGPAARR
jgi:uncharacterized membrane protein YkvA (DUF1232 family)